VKFNPPLVMVNRNFYMANCKNPSLKLVLHKGFCVCNLINCYFIQYYRLDTPCYMHTYMHVDMFICNVHFDHLLQQPPPLVLCTCRNKIKEGRAQYEAKLAFNSGLCVYFCTHAITLLEKYFASSMHQRISDISKKKNENDLFAQLYFTIEIK
jgi:hypothetical protein